MNAARFSWKLKSSRASLFFSGDDQIEEQQQKKTKEFSVLECSEAVSAGPLNREEEAGNWHRWDDANQTRSSLLLS